MCFGREFADRIYGDGICAVSDRRADCASRALLSGRVTGVREEGRRMFRDFGLRFTDQYLGSGLFNAAPRIQILSRLTNLNLTALSKL